MPRIRAIKPEFFDSPDVAELSFAARLLFIAMWTWADDYGVGLLHPVKLASYAFPSGEVGSKELPCVLKELLGRSMIAVYGVGRRDFYEVPAWEAHQRMGRRAETRNPGREQSTSDVVSWLDLHVCECADMKHGSSLRPQGSSLRPQGNVVQEREREREREREVEREIYPPPAPSTTVAPRPVRAAATAAENEAFNRFYETYPRHVAKADAAKAFTKAAKEHGTEQIITAAKQFATIHQQSNSDLKYVPYPATWLNKKQFLDDYTENHAAPAAKPKHVTSFMQGLAAVQATEARERNQHADPHRNLQIAADRSHELT